MTVALASLVNMSFGDYLSLLVSESAVFFASVPMNRLGCPAKQASRILLVKGLDSVLSCGWCHLIVVGETTEKAGSEWQQKRQ
jgi:hypothetical protein